MRIRCSNSQAGFNLIQISILLTVASLVMVAVLPSPQSTFKNNATSVVKMNAILTALRQYQAANATLPCPADPTLPVDSANYGLAAANAGATGNCIGGTPSAAYADTTNHIAIGMVPFRDLGLSYDYALDAWGRDITYAVDTNATAFTSALCSSPSFAGAITVNDYGISHNTVAALVSHGQDGYGAWLPLAGSSGSAKRLDSGSTDTGQADNAQVAHGGGLTVNTTFTSFKNQNATSTFDDNVVYKGQYNLNILPRIYTQTTAYSQTCTGYYRTVTIDHTKVPNTDQSNFPMLFSGTYPYLATVANGGNVQNANGYDIYFSSDAAGTNKLNFERESYNASTGQVIFWVQVPAVSHTSDTVIYLQYGKAYITTDQSNKTGMWNNYKGVWHFDEASGSAVDSTSYGTSGTITGTVIQGTTGAIGTGYSFSGSSGNHVSMGNPGDGHLDFGTTSFTYSAWIKMTSAPTSGNYYVWFYKGGSNSATAGYNMEINSLPVVDTNIADGATIVQSYLSTITPLQWTYVVGVVDRSSQLFYLYKNGTQIGSSSISSVGSVTSTQSLWLGEQNSGSQYPLNGSIDEVHISSGAKSADWIATEYNNQSSPSTFYAIGAQTSSR